MVKQLTYTEEYYRHNSTKHESIPLLMPFSTWHHKWLPLLAE